MAVIEEILEKLLKLEGKIQPKKYIKRHKDGNKKLVITLDKGPIKDYIIRIQNNRIDRFDDELGESVLVFNFEYFDAAADNGFLYANITLLLDIVRVENKLAFTTDAYGTFKDPLGIEAEMPISHRDGVAPTIMHAMKDLESIVNDKFEDKYIGPARSQLIELIENCMV